MSALIDYLARADSEEKRELLRRQYQEAVNDGVITCGCGWRRALTMAYRCLYCGVYFCHPCAEKHFGMTVKEWIEKKENDKEFLEE